MNLCECDTQDHIVLEAVASKLDVRFSPELYLTRLSSSSFLCRICQSSNFSVESLISPCKCRGSLAYVHLSCLEKWLNQSGRSSCELCGHKYNSERTLRYTLWESMSLWFEVPTHRAQMKADILIAALLSFVTMGLMTVCLIGMEYFVVEGKRLGISRNMTTGGLFLFLAIVLLGYAATIYLLIKDQLAPWYNWWKKSVEVKLKLTSSVMSNAVRHNLEDGA